ncbi:hypothetical protein E2C01_020628 [Portunus trituberculatus]|uniref:Uncharacterized protein n=1 Tax=Portunus trituberculatus TaxID=210409 RepID=A0A5B7E108_PORTR|nr:hypothetical protein [Portunus trituberculatus]
MHHHTHHHTDATRHTTHPRVIQVIAIPTPTHLSPPPPVPVTEATRHAAAAAAPRHATRFKADILLQRGTAGALTRRTALLGRSHARRLPPRRAVSPGQACGLREVPLPHPSTAAALIAHPRSTGHRRSAQVTPARERAPSAAMAATYFGRVPLHGSRPAVPPRPPSAGGFSVWTVLDIVLCLVPRVSHKAARHGE